MRYYLIVALLIIGIGYFAWNTGLSGKVQEIKNDITTHQTKYEKLFDQLK